MKSYWSVLCVESNHGNFLRKLGRLAHFAPLEVESERFILNKKKVVHFTFFVVHEEALTWDGLVLEILETAKSIFPVWKITIETKTLSGETSQNIDGSNIEYEMRITGHRNISWSINESQQYVRTKWLNGSPNHW